MTVSTSGHIYEVALNDSNRRRKACQAQLLAGVSYVVEILGNIEMNIKPCLVHMGLLVQYKTTGFKWRSLTGTAWLNFQCIKWGAVPELNTGNEQIRRPHDTTT